VLGKYVTVSLGVLLLALLAASALLSRLQSTVTAPVTSLVRLMEGVSRDKDYSRRAAHAGPEELVSLAGSFNDMLTAIQTRDRELERSLHDLQDAYRKLKDLDRLKSDFLSTVSHELRTPITSIKAFVEILMMKPNMSDERREHIIGTITTESDRLSRLINDLLDLSRIESGSLQWRDEHVGVGDVVRSAMESVRPLAMKKEVSVRGEIREGLPAVYADRDRIMQVVMNLLSNAVKFTPAGGDIMVSASLGEEHGGVIVAISDTGPGIPLGERDAIFEKFHRSGDILTSSVEGTGLGLAIAREIIDHYGGRIWVTSEQGKGSVFHFTLPTVNSAL
jgi:signal transduction histidine kinase